MQGAPEFSERRLERAVQHVSAHWFPTNPVILANIRKGLEEGAYDLDTTFLITELKSDFALFTFCVKELLVQAAAEKVPVSISSDPMKLLRWAGLQRLRAVLNSDNPPPSSHSLRGLTPELEDRLRETAVAASAAEVLGENEKLDPEAAFCHAVVRQIGLNLISWNYPTLYSRVLKALNPRTTLEEELSKELGFSPAVLAFRLLRPEIDERNPQINAVKRSWQVYDSLCEIGEALARASNPEVYPSAEHDWEHAQTYIQRAIGPHGLDLIKRRAIENTEQYSKVIPQVFSPLVHLNPEEEIRGYRRSLRAQQNPYLKQCPPAIQAALKALYAEMPTGEVNKSVLERLIKQVIPMAGFTGGCVFVVDPSAMSLVPRTAIGRIKLRNLTNIALKSAPGAAMAALIVENLSTGSRPTTDPAVTAFACDQPLIERSEVDQPEVPAGIYCSLGKKRKIGVLYLEVPERELSTTDPPALKTYKALRHALCDALLVE